MTVFGRFFKKSDEKKPNGLEALMDPTVAFVGKLHALGGVGYVLLGGGLLLVFVTMTVARDLIAKLFPLSIALVLAGTSIVVVWQILEYRVAMLKLSMIISITKRMVEKKIETENYMDTAVMKEITGVVLYDIWGLRPGLLPGEDELKRRKQLRKTADAEDNS